MARRTIWSVLAAVLLCLVMLPATALAAVPSGQVIYVGNENVTNGGYWTTSEDGQTITSVGDSQPSSGGYIHYDADNNTLTLHNATIKKALDYDDNPPNSLIHSAAIGVLNQNGAAELTITLEGTNTIAEVGKGIYVLANSTGGATLTITGDGSLDASASQTGIWVQSNNGNAALFIQNAKVEATGTSTAGYGVNVQSSNSSTAALAVDGGSLAASGSPGILYDSIGSGTVPNTTALTISNSAIVDARGGGIGAGLLQDLKEVSPADDSVGIVFGLDLSDSKAGDVYGDVTLQEDLEIGEGESLTIPDGASLNTDGKLTVDGGTLNGTPSGDVTYKVTKVELSQSALTLDVGESETLTATITPTDATNQKVTWSSSDSDVATVDTNGNVTAVGAGTATITVTTEDGGKTATCAVTVIAKTYDISASPTELSFGSVYVGYAQPAAKTVTVTNKGKQTVTLTLPTSASYEIGNLSAAELKPNGTATFTVQPKLGLGVGTYAETLTISGLDGDVATVFLSFSVSSRPYIPPTPSGPDWDDVTGDIASAEVGGRVVVGMDSETVLPGEVLEALAGHDVTLVLEMGDGVAWEIYGGDVPEGTSLSDVDMGVELGTSGIPVDVVELVTGEAGSTQVTLAHEGPFGFELTLVAPVGEKYEGLFANAYRYDAAAGVLRYEAAGVVGDEGAVRVQIDHASSWLLALDSRSHALPFADASEGQWYSEPVRWAWLHGVMIGYADGSGLFGTGDELTRAQMAAVLYNAAGRPEVEVTGLPSDCDASAWYAQAVAWALEQGIFHGYGDGSAFGPGDPLTREQAACVLHNAAGGPASGSDLSSFSDSGEVSEWAEAAVSWAVAEGVLHGHDGLLEPARALTRAEAAALMVNLAARD